jgi:hypothetical protein
MKHLVLAIRLAELELASAHFCFLIGHYQYRGMEVTEHFYVMQEDVLQGGVLRGENCQIARRQPATVVFNRGVYTKWESVFLFSK